MKAVFVQHTREEIQVLVEGRQTVFDVILLHVELKSESRRPQILPSKNIMLSSG